MSNLWKLIRVVGASAMLACPAVAQNPNQAPFGQAAGAGNAAVNRAIIHVDGTLVGIVGSVAKITDTEGTEVMVQLPQDPSHMRFNAVADPQGIRPGMMVRFSTNIGPNGLPVEPVDQVELFHPIRTNNMPAHLKEAVVPGVYPAKRGPKPPPGVIVPGTYKVVGTLAQFVPGKGIAVVAGQTPIQVPLSEEARYLVRTNSLELSQAGDKVSVDAFYDGVDKTKVVADSFTVSTERLIGTPSEDPRKSRRRRGRDKVEADEPKAAEPEAVEPKG